MKSLIQRNTKAGELTLFVLVSIFISGTLAGERILLESLKVITLHHGRLTNGRRSAPVPQLQCVGGSAGCSEFVPQVVQCKNMGSDGYDAQWECKTDMSNKYRFGRIDVNCEGYDHPNDPYVLRGSCGLRYTLDRVKGSRREKKRGHSNLVYSPKGSGFFGNILVVAIVCVVIFFIYKTCLAPQAHQEEYERPPPYAPRDPPPYPSEGPSYQGGGTYGAPPPPGFRPEYTGKSEDCNTHYRGATGQQQAPPQTEGGGPGFFTGAFGGAVLGYLFGSAGQSRGYNQPYYSGCESSSYQDTPSRLYPDLADRHSTSSSSSSDGGTRTASGFGGTSRR